LLNWATGHDRETVGDRISLADPEALELEGGPVHTGRSGWCKVTAKSVQTRRPRLTLSAVNLERAAAALLSLHEITHVAPPCHFAESDRRGFTPPRRMERSNHNASGCSLLYECDRTAVAHTMVNACTAHSAQLSTACRLPNSRFTRSMRPPGLAAQLDVTVHSACVILRV
jgi:hypothetical protein